MAGTWGTLGRLALDWYLRFAGFNESPEQPALTFAIGSVPVWAAVAIALWTPLTLPLQRATVRRSVLLGVFAAAVGTWMLYGLFVIQMGLPSSFVQAVNVLLFFPIFFATALMMGGLIALPATVGTAVLLRVLLQAMDGGQAEQGHPLDAQENARK